MGGSKDGAAAWRRVALTGSVLVVASVVPAKRRDPPRHPPYGVDKLAHAVAHGAFAGALFDAVGRERSTGRAALCSLVVSTASAVALELLQRRVPGRRFESGDVVAGAVGSAGGVGVGWLRTGSQD
jgi:VanZ family protein